MGNLQRYEIGSLFGGVGGLELGLERAGLGETAWQVEQNEFCRGVLASHWPRAKRFVDVREVGAHNLAPVDLICGGFPCQDLSQASRGRGRGLEGERSGLWREYRRIVDELRPLWVVVENVSGAAERRWLPSVRRDLWGLGYSSLPLRVRASDVGAPFAGARCFVAATNGDCQSALAQHGKASFMSALAKVGRSSWGTPSPTALGLANGVPRELDELTAYGNAIPPQQSQVVGEVIKEIERLANVA